MKLISSSPFTNNHSLSSHLALFLSHLLRETYSSRAKNTKLLTKPPLNKKFTHTQTLNVVTLRQTIQLWRALPRRGYSCQSYPLRQIKVFLATEMPNSYLLFSKLEYLDFLMTHPLFMRTKSPHTQYSHTQNTHLFYSKRRPGIFLSCLMETLWSSNSLVRDKRNFTVAVLLPSSFSMTLPIL